LRCKQCKNKAVINLRSYNLSLCKDHYIEFFEKKVFETIKRYRLFREEDLIVIAVSGGKDSLALWYLLSKSGYSTHGFHINLGIKENNYSYSSEQKVRKFAEKQGLAYTIISLEEYLGMTIDDHRKLGQRSACSTCGVIKRYLMNSFTGKIGAKALATGHNLDDEAAVLLGNLLNWQIGYLKRQHPRLPEENGFFVARVKPFSERTEREVAAYALLNGIDYVVDECPYSRGATSISYKKILNEIEERSPGAKLRFFRGFIDNKHLFEAEAKGKQVLIPCELCGQPTTHSPCVFCRIKQRANEIRS
jgi:uncharacterized protein (TIGR00269 family)